MVVCGRKSTLFHAPNYGINHLMEITTANDISFFALCPLLSALCFLNFTQFLNSCFYTCGRQRLLLFDSIRFSGIGL
jgi:hypothetical protein